jgi:hypothetical protein
MMRTLTIAAATVIFAAPLVAQNAAPTSAPPSQAPVNAPAANDTAAIDQTTGDQTTQAADPKGKAKPKAKTEGGTVVRAGPNAGMVVGKARAKEKDEPAAKDQNADQATPTSCTADHPCG